MAVFDKLRRAFGGGDRVEVRLMLKGRIGPGWYDVDETLRVPSGTTLQELVERAEKAGIPLAEALDNSPHLRHTLMWNGERCPVDEHGKRAVSDGEEIYLLAPLAGG